MNREEEHDIFTRDIFKCIIHVDSSEHNFCITMIIRTVAKNKISFSKICLLWIVFICTLIFPMNFKSNISVKNIISEKKIISIDKTKTYITDTLEEENEEKKSMSIAEIWAGITILLILYDSYFYGVLRTNKK